MRVWIDQDLCIGNGVCEEIAPQMIVIVDGLAYVRQGDMVMAASHGHPEGPAGTAQIPDHLLVPVVEAAEACPTECIYIEP
jgi:ferredoxin